MIGAPWYVWTLAASAAGVGIAAWVLRWEFRHQLRARRHGGYIDLAGGGR